MNGQRIVVCSGHPTERELAAIVAALAEHSQPAPATIGAQPSAWIRAARLEGRGHQPIDDPFHLLTY